MRPHARRRKPRRVALAIAVSLAAVLAAFWYGHRDSLVVRLDAPRMARIAQSPQWRDGRFHDAQAMWTADWRAALKTAFDRTPEASPDAPVPVAHDTKARLAVPSRTGLRVTWFGHSSALVEVDGVNVLVDPLWSQRVGPVDWAGPQRWFPAPLALRDLPRIDAVVISHDHYDHLDRATVVALDDGRTRFVVPLGVGAWLSAWGIAGDRIVELDWWQSTRIAGLRIVATPGRHASGRLDPQSDKTLWAGYALLGPVHRVWYSGDTGLHDTLDDIGRRYGPFDATLIEAGQYDVLWPDWHLGPEQAVEAHLRVRGKVMIPVHWGLLKLANHGWTEPAERVLAAAQCRGADVLIPEPGEAVEPTLAHRPAHWWPHKSWRDAGQTPVVATRGGDPARRVPVPVCAGQAARGH